ncbi:MAG: hypothetical protein B6D58_07535 [candidate division Zixibacteria bacterium 4484_95]|nr:MAG: hypothetical protein B6D58_07535 [candidate division Zixibacteria bacterium 4484_95]
MMRSLIVSSILTICMACCCLSADTKEKPLDLVHADRLLSSGEDINNVTNLIGNVHLKHGSTQLWSSRAVWYKKTDVVVFIDSVRLVDGSRILTGQMLTYYRNLGSATVTGDVVMMDQREELKISASRVDYDKDKDIFIATGGLKESEQPVFTIYPDDEYSRTRITSDTIIYRAGEKIGFANGSVVITRNDMVATCTQAEFRESGEEIILVGEPQVIQGKNLLEGDEIKLRTKDRTLTRMVIDGKAKATYLSQPDTALDQYTKAILEGKQLEVFFSDDKPFKSVMRRNATSHYIPAVNDTFVRGVNVASGDSITLFFDGSQVDRVLILGGARGHYVENKLHDGEVVPETTYYNGQQIDYKVNESLIELLWHSRLKYQKMSLDADRILYNINDEILIAEGLAEKTDSGEVVVGSPVLREGGDELYGKRMTYNIRTRKGKVELGETEFEGGFYKGKLLRQVEKDVLYVNSGYYTTCNLEKPHYYFYSQKMKMITKDKVIAKPVILFIGSLPVMAIPYYVFPIRKGRHSGFLTFELGNFEEGERFIRNLGYYWAASDYWDIQTSLDFYESEKVVINGKMNYALRYRLNGMVGGSFTRQTDWVDYERNVRLRWGLNFSHNQTLTPTLSLRAGGTFQSDKTYNQDNNYDPEERLNRTVRSNASLTQRWKSASMSVALDQSWNLDTDVKIQLLPTISFSRSSLPIITPPSKKKRSNKRILPWEEKPEEAPQRWYHSIYFSISSKFQNKRNQSKKNDILDWQNFKTLDSRINISSPQKLLGILTISPTASIRQTFYKIDKVHIADTVDVVTDDYFRREVWSAGLNAKTTLYGAVYPKIFHITGLRHVMTPSVSYGYAPKTERNKQYYDYTRVGSSSRKKKSMSFSLSNLFQMKFQKGDEELKLDLFNLNFSTIYDFEKEEKKWGDLSSVVNSRALKIVDLSISSTHSFYDEITGRRRLFDPRLVSISASVNFSHRFRFPGIKGEALEEEEKDTTFAKDKVKGGRSKGGDKNSLLVSISHRYSERHSLGDVSKTRWIDASFDLGLTAGWRIKYDCHYDLELKRASSQNLKLSRDLHCWQGEFVWVPTGPLAGYYFRINIKKLPDIKIEQTVGGVRGKYY